MTLRWMPCFAAVAAVSFSLVVVASIAPIATGCTSDEVTPTTPAPTQCPLTLSAANGSACAEGLTCPYEFTCGAFQQQATCTCVNGLLACADDRSDASLPVGVAPTCTPQSNPAACPAQEPPDNLTTCTAIGLTCLYTGLVCPKVDAGPNFDTCECHGGHDGGLFFDCVVSECHSDGLDAGADGRSPDGTAPLDGGGDDGGDASSDSGDDGG